jgi:sugar O-acyltransferase (sialic acid O-acetyltransferase NeuD family)
MTLVVLCAGGHARVVVEALLSRGIRPDSFTDRDPARMGTSVGGVPIVGSDDHVLTLPAAATELANGRGNRATRTSSGLSGRRGLFERFVALGYGFPVIAHVSAVIASDVSPAEGAQMMAGSIVQPGARIGRNVLINTRAVVEHDCQVGDHSHIAPGAVLCGGVAVGGFGRRQAWGEVRGCRGRSYCEGRRSRHICRRRRWGEMNGVVFVTESMPLLEALRRIDKGNLQLAVVERDGWIVGTVTDGDVRRGLLNGVSLDAPVEQVMNRTPITAPAGISDTAALTLMRRKSIHQLPIVDAEGKVIEVKLIDDLVTASQSDHWVVLMAGGLGSRLKPLTDDLPKPLIKVGDKPILETVLGGFIKSGFGKFFISVNYKADMIREYFGDGSAWGVEIEYLQERDRLGTAGALALMPERPTQPFFVMNGDLLTTVNFEQMLKYHREHKAFTTVCVREHSVTVPFGVVDFDDHRVLGIREKPTQKFFVNAGVYLLDPGVLEFLRQEEVIDMPTLIERTIADDKPSIAFPLREYWIDVGRLDDLQRASDEFQRIFG